MADDTSATGGDTVIRVSRSSELARGGVSLPANTLRNRTVIGEQVKESPKAVPGECGRHLSQDHMSGNSWDQKFHENTLGILKSWLVEAKRRSSLQELTANVKPVWANFKPATLRNMPVGMPQHVFMCLPMK